MKIVIINGSPKGQMSNTMILTNKFVEGMKEANGNDFSTEQIDVCRKEINACIGCYSCWTKTPGKCIHNDDMDAILATMLSADCIVWSLPVYFHSMPSGVKALMDRMLPINMPFMVDAEEGNGHVARYHTDNIKMVLISTGGFPEAKNNFEALCLQFEIVFQKSLASIVVPQGELFQAQGQVKEVDDYLGYVKEAGTGYIKTGAIDDDLRKQLNQQLFPTEIYNKMADGSWDVAQDSNSQESDG